MELEFEEVDDESDEVVDDEESPFFEESDELDTDDLAVSRLSLR